MLSIIVAVDSNWAIGKENNLLWHISEDLKFFKRTTLGSPIIMGYNTFLSLGSKALSRSMLAFTFSFRSLTSLLSLPFVIVFKVVALAVFHKKTACAVDSAYVFPHSRIPAEHAQRCVFGRRRYHLHSVAPLAGRLVYSASISRMNAQHSRFHSMAVTLSRERRNAARRNRL